MRGKKRLYGAGWARAVALAAALGLAACGGGGSDQAASGGGDAPTQAAPPKPITSVTSTPVATFAAPWAMAFLPDQRLLVTERVTSAYDPGRLWVQAQSGEQTAVSGLPANAGMLDVILSPQYRTNGIVYLSFLELAAPDAPRVGRDAADASIPAAGLAVATATLRLSGGTARLDTVKVIWRQTPKIVSYPGSGEPGGRMAFSPDGRYLFVAAGDRQEFDPVQQLDNTLGKIVRLNPDGTAPGDNPFVGRAGALPEIWTLGHRNPYGLAFDAAGLLWEHEMGPMGGDELNLIQSGLNYGWPNVSYGSAYTGEKYPDPMPGDGYAPAAYHWTPVIAPSGMIFYKGNMFAAWRGDAIISGLQSKGLVRVHFSGTDASEAQRVSLGARIRAIAEAGDGAIWVLEDAPTGRLLKLAPVF